MKELAILGLLREGALPEGTELDRIARFLEQALKRFDAGGEMRQ